MKVLFFTQSKAITDTLLIHRCLRKRFFLDFSFPMSLEIFSRSIFLSMFILIDIIAKFLSLFCEIADRKYVFISLSFEKLLSPDVTVTCIRK